MRLWMHRLVGWKTTTQVVALVVATMAASIALLTALNMRTQTMHAYEERTSFTIKQGENIERLLYAAEGNVTGHQNIDRIQHLIEDVGGIEGLTTVFFANRDGTILAHSQPDAIGRRYLSPDMASALDTGKVVTAKEAEEGEHIRLDIAAPVRYRGVIVGAIEAQFSLQSLDAEIASAQRDAWLSALLVAVVFIPVVSIFLARFQRTLEYMAFTDGLTGLYDHRFFRQRLDQEMKRSARYGHDLALILFDIDGFKSYNDTFGHLEGDEAIQQISLSVKQSIRDIDVPARYGGDEFAVILPETGLEQAYVVAERVRQAINLCCGAGGKPGVLTATFGIASYPADATSADDLIRFADIALYHAKLSGKNRSCVYSSVPSEVQLQPLAD